MQLPKKRKVAAVCGDGHIRLLEQEVPALKPGSVLLEVRASLVSPGTELAGWRGLCEKRRNPETEAEPKPFGYANAGRILAVGDGVREFRPGDRVACMGWSYAMHTDYAVAPHNLCVPLPDEVSFSQGSYAHLAATAVHALRRGEPEFGESVVVAGLGVVGQLSAQLYQLAGNFVIGWDTIPFRIGIAREWGIHASVEIGAEDEVAATKRFTNDYGADAAVIAFGGNATKTVQNFEKCMKCSPDGHPMGRIIVIGGATFEYTSSLTNIDVRRASRTGAGYHDEPWEFGEDYPPVFMRWTTKTNLELSVRLIAEGKLDVDVLTTHTIPLDDVDDGISAIIQEPDSILGVVFAPASD